MGMEVRPLVVVVRRRGEWKEERKRLMGFRRHRQGSLGFVYNVVKQ